MDVYRIAKCKYIKDLSGRGAASYGGRWNSQGIHVVYTAVTASLALLEIVAHIMSISKDDFCLATITIPDEKIFALKEKDLPSDWSSYPAPDKMKEIGDKFVKDNFFLALKIPSVIMPEENIILLNPNHPDFAMVKMEKVRTIPIDKRLV